MTDDVEQLFCMHVVVCLYVFSDLPNAHGLAVDWVSRNLFWTSYDANKKQINVARLDGSFKNAVIQGLDKPHCLVLHPILGLVMRTHVTKLSHRHPPDFTFNLQLAYTEVSRHTFIQTQVLFCWQ